MKVFKLVFVFAFIAFYFPSLKAQSLSGIVYELNSNEIIPQVEVINLSTSQSVYTDNKGSFAIPVKKDNLLSFSYPGYRVDTMMIIDFDFKRVYLTPEKNMNILSEVEIRGMSDQQLTAEIEKARNDSKSTSTMFSGGIAISPSRLFGQGAKKSRRRYELLLEEQRNRLILKRFNPLLISSLTPLKGRDLSLFMVKYKPSYEFANTADDEQIKLYIFDSYKKYKALTKEEKDQIELVE